MIVVMLTKEVGKFGSEEADCFLGSHSLSC